MTDTGFRIFRYNNLTGGINTTAEENALVTFSNPNQPVQAELRDAENFGPIYRGGQSKLKGFSLFKDLGTAAAITGIYRFIKSDGTSLFLASSANTLYKIVSGAATALSTSISNGAYLDFQLAYDKCIICDGVNGPFKFDGTTVSALGGSPPGAARQSLFYQNRLFVFAQTNNTSLLYYSDGGNIESGYSTNFINCDINDGQQITAIGKFYVPGSLTPTIFVAKTRSIGIITGSGTTTDPYSFNKINTDVGVPGFRQLAPFGQDLAFFTNKGVASYSTSNSIINLVYNYLSDKIRDRFLDLPSDKLSQAIAWNDWKKSRLSFAVTETSYSNPNVIYHFDYRVGAWYKERHPVGYTITSVFVDTDGVRYHGDASGKIYNYDEDITNFNSQAINGYFKTPYLDFGQPGLKKQLVYIKISARGNGSYPIGVGINYDYGVRSGTSTQINLDAGSYLWGGGVWTNDPDVYQWGANAIKNKTIYPNGYFDNIQLTFSNSGIDQPIDIINIEFAVQPMEIR